MRRAKHTRNPDDGTAPHGSLRNLEDLLAGSFRARPGNLTGSRLDLYGPSRSGALQTDVVVGELRLDGSERATLDPGDGLMVMESHGGVASVSLGDTLLLSAVMRDASHLYLERSGVRYDARVSALRNSARAHLGRDEVCRVAGSLFGRSYEANFREGLLPVAVFLLWRTVLLRRKAFTVSSRE